LGLNLINYFMFSILKYFSSYWYSLSLLTILIFSFILRFWSLGQFNELVFDEVYYAKFANDYLTHKQFFNAHPPLSQYIIAIGIWLGSFLPAPHEMINNLTGSIRSTISYRWINALSGSFVPLLVSFLCLKLTLRRSYSILAGALISLDGLFLVESRYALNNIYLVLFGLLGNLFILHYLSTKKFPLKYLILAGIFFGAAACIKWNGLWFLLGVIFLFLLGYINSIEQYYTKKTSLKSWLNALISTKNEEYFSPYPLNNLTQINPIYHILILTVTATVTYSILWIPHLIMEPEYNFIEMQHQILAYHERIGSAVHPYCSKWYSWILMLRPIAYYYKESKNVVHDVHSMANPFLLWLSSLAIVTIVIKLIIDFVKSENKKVFLSPVNWIFVYFVFNYLANLLPWIKVSRCIFFYHYIESYTFSILALAWIVDGWLHSGKQVFKIAGVSALVLIVLAFIFWLPIYIGLPLSRPEFNLRMLFPSWI